MTTTARPHNISHGTYLPSKPGARTIAESRPAYTGDERISVEVSDQVTLFHGLRIVYQGDMPAGVETASDLHLWAATYRPSARDRVVEVRTLTPKAVSNRVIDDTMPHAWLVGCETTDCEHRVLVAKSEWRPVDFADPDGPMIQIDYSAPGRRYCAPHGAINPARPIRR